MDRRPDPTPEEIARLSEEIQKNWSERMRIARSMGLFSLKALAQSRVGRRRFHWNEKTRQMSRAIKPILED